MNRVFPCSEYLNQEEVDYELMIRSQPEDVFALDLAGKQRLLRKLFKEDSKEGRSYRSPYTIAVEADYVTARIDTLEKALEKRVEAKFESRVLHYWYRVKWSKASGEEQKKIRRELCKRIESIMRHYQFGPPQSPVITQINNIITGTDQEGAVGGQDNGNEEDESHSTSDKEQSPEPSPEPSPASEDEPSPEGSGTGTKPKPPKPKFEVTQEDWNDMRRLLAQLEFHVSRTNLPNPQKTSGKEKTSNAPNPFVFPPPSNKIPVNPNPIPRNPIQSKQPVPNNASVPLQPKPQGSNLLPALGPRPTDKRKQPLLKPLNIYQSSEYSSTEEESVRNSGHRTPEASDSEDTSEPVYENMRPRRHRRGPPCRHGHQNRVEKWKLRFSGDQRSMSVETFLYKAKKIGRSRRGSEGVSFEGHSYVAGWSGI